MTYEKRVHFLVNFFYSAVVLGIVIFTVKYGWEYLSPFVLAFAVAYILKSAVNKLHVYTKIKRGLCAVICVAAFYCITLGVFTLAAVQLFALLRNLFYALPDFYSNEIAPVLMLVLAKLQHAITNIDPGLRMVLDELTIRLSENVGNAISNISVSMLGALSTAIAGVPSFFVKTLLAIIASFFISADYYEITYFVAKQLNTKQVQLLYDVEQYAKSALVKYLKSYSLIMAITFCEVGTGLLILGVKRAYLIGFLIAVFDIMPVLGTGGILIPWGVISLITGNVLFGIGILVLYLIVTVVRNIIEPKIIGDQVGLPAVATLMSMFLGTKLMGVVGLFRFPVSLAILKQLNDAGKIKLFK